MTGSFRPTPVVLLLGLWFGLAGLTQGARNPIDPQGPVASGPPAAGTPTTGSSLSTGPPVSQASLTELRKQLGSERYADRRLAEKALLRIGTDAFDILQEALDDEDLEIAERAAYLIRKIEIQWTRAGDSRTARAILRAYAVASEEKRQLLMLRLASLPRDEGLEGLCRITRFEKSAVISSEAAVLVIAGQGHREPPRTERVERIQCELGPSIRPAARWLHAYVAMSQEPADSVRLWDSLFQKEKQRVASGTSSVTLLARLMYSVASIYQAQDTEEVATRIAGEALALEGIDAEGHLLIADMLERHGEFDWAEQEYRQVLQMGPAGQNGFGILTPHQEAASKLSSMLHELSQDLEAAKVLGTFYKIPVGNSTQARYFLAQKEFYFAAHFGKEENWSKQREHLEKAIKLDPSNADVLIAMYRFPKADPAYKSRTKRLIEKTSKSLERKWQNTPDNPTAYNQWAWLIGNTEGDYEKAIEQSHRSITLARRNLESADRVPGFLDTLGRCYYAKGDLKNAVKYQQQAADLMPYSRPLAKQLKLFQDALTEKENAAKTEK